MRIYYHNATQKVLPWFPTVDQKRTKVPVSCIDWWVPKMIASTRTILLHQLSEMYTWFPDINTSNGL